MADERSVVITLKLDNNGENPTDTSNQTSTSQTRAENDNNNVALAVAAYAVEEATKVVVGEVINWTEYYINRDLALNDDYIGQRNKTIALTQINRGISLASSLAGSAISGFAVGGIPGALVGLAIGTGAQVASIVRSNQQGQDQQNIMLRQMDAQLGFTRSRAGYSIKAASIGEDL